MEDDKKIEPRFRLRLGTPPYSPSRTRAVGAVFCKTARVPQVVSERYLSRAGSVGLLGDRSRRRGVGAWL